MSALIAHLTTDPAMYYLPAVYTMGLLGNLLNILVFCQPKLRGNCCSLYLICISLAHILMLSCPCLVRIVTVMSGSTIFSRDTTLCKSSTYLEVLSLLLSRCYLCLICVDRWMVTSASAWLRKRSSIRTARWAIGITSLCCLVFNIHSAVGYHVISGVVCTGARDYIIFSSIHHIVIAIGPLLILLVFSGLTLMSLRQVGRRTQPLATLTTHTEVEGHAIRKRELQFIRLCLLQVFFYMLLNALRTFMPIVIYYITIVYNTPHSQRSLVYLLYYWGDYLLYTYAAVSIHDFAGYRIR